MGTYTKHIYSLAVILLSINLTGCFTINLSNNIESKKYSKTVMEKDSFTDVYIDTAKNSEGNNKAIQIKGDKYSYIFFEAQALDDIYSKENLYPDELSITIDGNMDVTHEKPFDSFSSHARIDYKKNVSNDEIIEVLNKNKFKCNESNRLECSKDKELLSGMMSDSIVQSKTEKVFKLNKPIPFTIEKYTTVVPPDAYGLMLLYPFAIIGDILTSPIQIILLPMMNPAYGK